MTKYIIDSYAWIEYLDGTDKGEKVKAVLSNEKNECYIIGLVFAEVVSKAKRRGGNWSIAAKAIKTMSQLLPMDFELSENAALIHAEKKQTMKDFSLTDAFVLAASKHLNAKILTGDEHFRKVKEAIFVR